MSKKLHSHLMFQESIITIFDKYRKDKPNNTFQQFIKDFDNDYQTNICYFLLHWFIDLIKILPLALITLTCVWHYNATELFYRLYEETFNCVLGASIFGIVACIKMFPNVAQNHCER